MTAVNSFGHQGLVPSNFLKVGLTNFLTGHSCKMSNCLFCFCFVDVIIALHISLLYVSYWNMHCACLESRLFGRWTKYCNQRVCMSVRLLTYLRKHMSKLHQIFVYM